MPKFHTCDVCNKAFPVKSELARHMRSHEGTKPYSCETCGKKFSQDHHLKDHIRTHTGERPHKCPVCEKAFAHSASLSNHMLSHKSVHLHVCPTCKRTFTRNSSLQLHMQNVHSSPTTDVTTESHKEPVGTVTTTTQTTSTSSGTTSVSYIQSPNTEQKAPVQVVTQSVGSTETTIVTQSSGTFIHSESFDAFQEDLSRTLTDD